MTGTGRDSGGNDHRRRAKVLLAKRRRKMRMMMAGMLLLAIALIFVGGNAIHNHSVQKKTEAAQAKKAKAQEKKESEEKEKKAAAKKQAEQIQQIKEDAMAAGASEELVNLIDKNKEIMPFVENYAAHKDDAPADTIGELPEDGSVPRLYQWDEGWGYQSYGTSTIAASGCGPTCMSMVVAYLAKDTSATPYVLAKYSESNGYIDETNSTYWAFMNSGASDWGITATEGMMHEDVLAQELMAGHPVICSVGPGDFTKSGHFIVLTGYEDGKVTVNDPFNKAHSEKTWVYADIADQIVGMWTYSI